MKRGEVWWVSFDPSLGGEITKTRPAVIVSNNANNRASNRVQVVPLTSSTGKCYPCETLVTIKNTVSIAMADQVMTVSKLRFKDRIGELSENDMAQVNAILRLQLDLRVND